jgi:hypothetical protein
VCFDPRIGGAQVSVLTHHNDNGRTGQNLQETALTLANVNANDFGKRFHYVVDGAVYAQPLYVPNVAIPGVGARNVVYLATQHDSVYAFDADAPGDPLWHVSFIDPDAGITPVSNNDVGGSPDIAPEIGITGTPVIDPATGTLFVVPKTKEHGTIVQRLHALDIATGAEKFGGPVTIAADVPGTGRGSVNGVVSFDALRENQRPGLLLHDGVVYIAWASHGDAQPYHGWIIGYDAETLAQVAVLNTTPNGGAGGIWQSGAGLSTDADGFIYGATGNGTFNVDTGGVDYGDSILKLRADDGLQVVDYFTPYNQAALSRGDFDLGSTGVLILPDQPGAHPHLALAASKEGTIYLVDRDAMGQFNPTNDSQIVQWFPKIVGPAFGMPAYFNGTVYIWAASDYLKAFRLTDGLLSTAPVSQAAVLSAFPGGCPSISADGDRDGIVWVVQVDKYRAGSPGILRAYDARDLAIELYNSAQVAADAGSPAVKFVAPTIVNGKVYVGGNKSVTVYGLRNAPPTASATVTSTPLLTPTPTDTPPKPSETAVTPTPTTITPQPSVTPSPTTTGTPTPPPCIGDCDGDGHVRVDELIDGVKIALGLIAVEQCSEFDCNATGMVTIDCLVQAVGNALEGCPEA